MGFHRKRKFFVRPIIFGFVTLHQKFLKKMALFVQKRWEIVFLCRHKPGPKLGFKAAAKYVGCSAKTAHRWVLRYESTGDVCDEEGRGRKRKTNTKEDNSIVQIAAKKRKVSSTQIAQQMIGTGTNISSTTVRRRLNEAGYEYLDLMGKPLLTDASRENRLKWGEKNLNRDWSSVIFTDEATIDIFRNPNNVWKKKGERVQYPKVKHPLKVHVWGCICGGGFGNIYCFTENMNSELLCKIYQKSFIPSAKMLFGAEDQTWVIQEDNDPKHKSKKATNFRAKYNIKKIP